MSTIKAKISWEFAIYLAQCFEFYKHFIIHLTLTKNKQTNKKETK